MERLKDVLVEIVQDRNIFSEMEGKLFVSPTAALELIITILMIVPYKNRFMTIADIPCAYSHMSSPPVKKLILTLVGTFVNIMCEVKSDYSKHIIRLR